jgi:hypothetical protein
MLHAATQEIMQNNVFSSILSVTQKTAFLVRSGSSGMQNYSSVLSLCAGGILLWLWCMVHAKLFSYSLLSFLWCLLGHPPLGLCFHPHDCDQHSAALKPPPLSADHQNPHTS